MTSASAPLSAIRLVAFDIDGTLLGSDKVPQPGTLRAFEAMREADTRIMLASGRPIPGLKALAARCGLGEDLIFAGLNGSVVVDQATEEILARHPVPPATAQPIIDLGRQLGIVVMLPHDAELVVGEEHTENAQVRHEAAGNGLAVRGVEDVSRPDIAPTKVLFCAPRPELEALEQKLLADYGEQIELAYSSPIYMEATAAGVDKSTAIRDFCRTQGISAAQTMAFGDNGNDVTMLRAAGIGVAMGNAIPEAREAADIVTSSNDEEGIARVLAQHFAVDVPVS